MGWCFAERVPQQGRKEWLCCKRVGAGRDLRLAEQTRTVDGVRRVTLREQLPVRRSSWALVSAQGTPDGQFWDSCWMGLLVRFKTQLNGLASALRSSATGDTTTMFRASPTGSDWPCYQSFHGPTFVSFRSSKDIATSRQTRSRVGNSDKGKLRSDYLSWSRSRTHAPSVLQ